MGIAIIIKKAALSLQALALLLGFGAGSLATAVALSAPAYAACATSDTINSQNPLASGANCSQANGTSNNLFAQGGVFQTIANTLIFLVGAISVIFLIIGGLRYVISQGDKSNVTQAKDTILYAVIGIVVAVISFALVTFVISSLQKSTA
jgi:hypothetical protein